MRENWLEDQLNNRFEGMEPQLDLEAAWSTLESRRKRRRKGFFWFWPGTGVIVIGAALFFWFANNPNTDLVEAGITNLMEMEEQPTVVPIRIDRESEAIHEENKVGEQGTPIEKQEKTVDPVLPQIIPSASEAVESSPIQMAPIPAIEPTKDTESKAGSSYPLDFENKIPVAHSQSSPLTPLPLEVALLSHNTNLPELPGNYYQRALAEESNERSSLEIGLYGAYGWSFAPHLDTNFPFPEDMAKHQTVDRWTTGLQLSYQVTDRFQLRSGLEYFSLMNQTQGSWEEYSFRQEDDYLVELREYADGTIVEVYGEATVAVEEKVVFSVWETHNGWTVPLELGYSPILNDRFRVTLSSGVGYSFGMNREGKRLFRVGESIEFREIVDLPFRDKGLWSVRGGVELNYLLGSRFSLQFGINGGFDLSDHLLDDYPPAEKYSWVLGRLGVFYTL